jgi:DsbC/DsbD-like thiol-disulfide interchange protein
MFTSRTCANEELAREKKDFPIFRLPTGNSEQKLKEENQMQKFRVFRLVLVLTLLTAVLIVSGPVPVSQAQTKKKTSADMVEVKAAATKTDADGNQQITLHLTVKPGWYIYANPVGDPDFAGNETQVSVTGPAKPTDVKTTYPAGKVKSGAKYQIYEDKVVLTTTVRRAPGDNGALELTIQVNSCSHEGTCLFPGDIKLSVPSYRE